MIDQKMLARMLVKDEGSRQFPYKDSEGILTIGIGRNLEHNGLRHDEIMLMLENDIKMVEGELDNYPWFTLLDEVRRLVIADMCFNLGLNRLLKFKRMIAAIKDRDFDKASDEMMDSKWATQVGPRATRLAYMMRSGELHTSYLI